MTAEKELEYWRAARLADDYRAALGTWAEHPSGPTGLYCSTCKAHLPSKAFLKHRLKNAGRGAPDGSRRGYSCKECRRKYAAARTRDNRLLRRDPGFVNVITNDAAPGIVHVGRTQHPPETSWVKEQQKRTPFRFTVHHSVPVDFAWAVEGEAHTLLRAYRAQGKTWFAASVEEATSAVDKAVAQVRMYQSE